jgi:hypothetical protein
MCMLFMLTFTLQKRDNTCRSLLHYSTEHIPNVIKEQSNQTDIKL